MEVGGGEDHRPIVGRHVGSCTTDANDEVMHDDDDDDDEDVDEEEVAMNDTIICDRAHSRSVATECEIITQIAFASSCQLETIRDAPQDYRGDDTLIIYYAITVLLLYIHDIMCG